MSKKKTSTTNSETKQKNDLSRFSAFWALVISAFTYLFGGAINFIIGTVSNLGGTDLARILQTIGSIFVFLGNIALIIAIAIPAYSYVKGKKRGWKTCYYVALVVFALGVVFGLLSGII